MFIQPKQDQGLASQLDSQVAFDFAAQKPSAKGPTESKELSFREVLEKYQINKPKEKKGESAPKKTSSQEGPHKVSTGTLKKKTMSPKAQDVNAGFDRNVRDPMATNSMRKKTIAQGSEEETSFRTRSEYGDMPWLERDSELEQALAHLFNKENPELNPLVSQNPMFFDQEMSIPLESNQERLNLFSQPITPSLTDEQKVLQILQNEFGGPSPSLIPNQNEMNAFFAKNIGDIPGGQRISEGPVSQEQVASLLTTGGGGNAFFHSEKQKSVFPEFFGFDQATIEVGRDLAVLPSTAETVVVRHELPSFPQNDSPDRLQEELKQIGLEKALLQREKNSLSPFLGDSKGSLSKQEEATLRDLLNGGGMEPVLESFDSQKRETAVSKDSVFSLAQALKEKIALVSPQENQERGSNLFQQEKNNDDFLLSQLNINKEDLEGQKSRFSELEKGSVGEQRDPSLLGLESRSSSPISWEPQIKSSLPVTRLHSAVVHQAQQMEPLQTARIEIQDKTYGHIEVSIQMNEAKEAVVVMMIENEGLRDQLREKVDDLKTALGQHKILLTDVRVNGADTNNSSSSFSNQNQQQNAQQQQSGFAFFQDSSKQQHQSSFQDEMGFKPVVNKAQMQKNMAPQAVKSGHRLHVSA